MTDPEVVGRHFDAAAPRYDADMERYGWAANALLASQLDELALRPRRVLDLGSGTGATLGTVLDCTNPESAVAVDISKAMAVRLWDRFQYDGRVRIFQEPIATFLAPPCGRYDLITAMGVLAFHTQSEQRALLGAVAQRLTPGGVFAGTYNPLLPGDELYSRPEVWYGDPEGQLVTYRRSPEEVEADLAANRLVVITNRVVSSLPLLDPGVKAGFVVARQPAG